jgi:hypothetical protein
MRGLFVALALFFVTCTAPRAQALTSSRVAPEVVPEALAIVSAVSEYSLHEPQDAVVALHVLARNAGEAATRSTTVRWSPEFAAVFTFLASDPPAASVLTDGAGWGVAQVAGLQGGEERSIALWFSVADGAAPPTYDLYPRIQVLAESGDLPGARMVGERLAIPLHAPERLKLRTQYAMDESAVARAVERAPFVPVTSRGVFGPAVGFAVLLLVATGAGVASALCRVAR